MHLWSKCWPAQLRCPSEWALVLGYGDGRRSTDLSYVSFKGVCACLLACARVGQKAVPLSTFLKTKQNKNTKAKQGPSLNLELINLAR